MTFQELYKKGNTYNITSYFYNQNDETTSEVIETCEIIDVRFSKTGRISAKIKNKTWGEFWTTSISPTKQIQVLHVNKNLISEDWTI